MTTSTTDHAQKSELERATAIELLAPGTAGTAGTATSPLRFAASIPDGWQQGKGAFGGLVIGILARALMVSESSSAGEANADAKRRALRSLTADLCGPALPGPAIVEVSTLRRGASVTYADARLLQGDDNKAILARASAALALPRAAVEPIAIRPFAPPKQDDGRSSWENLPILSIGPPLGPVFARKYEYRSTGPLPFAGGKDPITEGWIREKTTPTQIDEVVICGLLDAWWPTSFSIEPAPRAVATIGYTMQLLVDPRTLPASEPLFYRARGVASADNFFIEMRELWSGDRVVAMNQQTFALLS